MKPVTILPRRSLSHTPSVIGTRFARRGISTVDLDRTKGDRERIVILGSGWAGYTLSRQLDAKKFQPVVVSPRSYFVFTPLLASTAVGTLEFRTALESVRSRSSKVEFIQGWADDVNFNEKRLMVEESAIEDNQSVALTADPDSPGRQKKGKVFDLKYDKLVVAVGCYSQTFGTKGVKENALFLKDVGDARKIRKRVLDCFENASLPSTSEETKKQLLNFAVVGGGPTGIEFSAELCDLCSEDLAKLYPSLMKYVKITVYDVAPNILSMFDESLANYAAKSFARDGMNIKTSHHIEELRLGLPGSNEKDGGSGGISGFTLKTKEEGEVGVGMCIWSTGLMMNPFIQKALNDVHTYPSSSAQLKDKSMTEPENFVWNLKRDPRSGGLVVDDQFHVKLLSHHSAQPDSSTEAVMNDVFAIGDVAKLEKGALPATAQVANQEAKWLGKRLNRGDLEQQNFTFKNLGVMTYLGNWRAIMQTGGNNEVKGWAAWVIWRGAYLTQTISWRNKLLIPIYWVVNWIFGRDISRF